MTSSTSTIARRIGVFFIAAIAAALAIAALSLGCSGDGGDRSPVSAATVEAPTSPGPEGCAPAPFACELVSCTSYANPQSRPITVDARWRERLDLCCAFRLCEVGGQCRYGCPTELTAPGC
jgi:hypothetical protein